MVRAFCVGGQQTFHLSDYVFSDFWNSLDQYAQYGRDYECDECGGKHFCGRGPDSENPFGPALKQAADPGQDGA